MLGATDARLSLLGRLLKRRRAALGYRHVPAFVRDRDINTRMVGDIEHGRRDTYTYPSLHDDVARAYDVTYESMIDVVWSDAGELVPASVAPADPGPAAPAASPPPAAVPGLPPPPESRLIREADVRPYADPIWEKLIELRDSGISDPDGGQLGLSPFCAKVWDDSAGAMLLSDRVWLVGTVLRNAAARDADRRPDANTA